jgi:hypothetical protein
MSWTLILPPPELSSANVVTLNAAAVKNAPPDGSNVRRKIVIDVSFG